MWTWSWRPNFEQTISVCGQHICLGCNRKMVVEDKELEWHDHIILYNERNMTYCPHQLFGVAILYMFFVIDYDVAVSFPHLIVPTILLLHPTQMWWSQMEITCPEFGLHHHVHTGPTNHCFDIHGIAHHWTLLARGLQSNGLNDRGLEASGTSVWEHFIIIVHVILSPFPIAVPNRRKLCSS